MLKSSNASASQNGYLFQINVAIYFMIKLINDLDTIRVEGQNQDVEIKLTDSSRMMIQVKSKYKDLENKNNVIEKLESALNSLYKSDGKDVSHLIYVSNLPDPLNNLDNEFTTYHGITIKKFSELSNNSKEEISNRISKIFANKDSVFNKDKLWIIRIPFYGEDSDEKHKFIYEIVKEFIYSINDKLSYKNFVEFWESKFLRNGASSLKNVISKKEIANYLILACTESYDISNCYSLLDINQINFDEACDKYLNFVKDKEECYEAICKVNYLYTRESKNRNVSKEEFIKNRKLELYNYFFEKDKKDIEELTKEEKIDMIVAEILSYTILNKRYIIERVNEKVNL